MSTFDNWLDIKEAGTKLRDEAAAIALKLGHSLVGWLWHENAFKSRCMKCHMEAVATPRSFTTAPIKGRAVTFYCKPEDKKA